MKNSYRKYLVLALCFFLFSCGDGGVDPPPPMAEAISFSILEQSNGITPFIKKLKLSINNYSSIASISYAIAQKEGTYSKPVSVRYSKAYLDRRAYYDDAQKQIVLPVFGLYAGYKNILALTIKFRDGSTRVDRVEMVTPAYDDPTKIYNAVDIKKARAANSRLNFDYVMIKNALTTPVVIDTDGNIRWVGAGVMNSFSSTFVDNGFVVGSQSSSDIYRLELDGTYTGIKPTNVGYFDFHHDLKPGKVGLLAEVDANVNGITKIESVLAEITAGGQVLKQWDLGAILSDAMIKGGDDPANFVRDGLDWFHMNSAVYSPSDNSLLISSRENFVMKIDYDSGSIKWLLGDTSKHWYVNYPSLRAYALTLTAGKSPIGQHTLSVASDGNLLLFNNGLGSLQNPAGTPAGLSRTFSAASKYAINETAKSASEIWTFENQQQIYSDVCSSVYESGVNTYLVNYAVAFNRTRAKLVGVDASGNIAFDFEYPSTICNTSWNAHPIGFENIVFS